MQDQSTPDVPHKQCRTCAAQLPKSTEYFQVRNACTDGLTSDCKACIRKREQAIRDKRNPPKEVRPGFKRCYRCNEWKPATPEYYRRSKGSKDGFSGECKQCRNVGPRPSNRVDLICDECGKHFSRKASAAKEDKEYYCGRPCASAGYKRLYSGQDSVHYNSAEIECAQCGKNLIRKGSLLERRDHHFCDHFCMGQWRAQNLSGENSPHYKRIETQCRHCGKEFSVIPRAFNEHGNFCDQRCYGEWRAAHFVGKDNPLWKGGKFPYYGEDWQRQRRKARKRDQYTCQRCSITEADLAHELDVHHKIPFRDFGVERHKEANHLSNLVCLCKRCHKLTEHNK